MKLRTLDDVRIRNKRILLRIDINSPVVKGKVLDSPRFSESAKTLQELLRRKAKVVILAHQGRKGDQDFLPLQQHAKILSRYVKKKILYVDDLFGQKAHDEIMNLGEGQAILLKNVRAYDDEITLHKNKRYRDFCKHFDIYVNDAFSVSHRKQESIVIPPRYLPSFIGRDFEKEMKALSHFHLKKKNVFLLGGAKVDDYLPLFRVLRHRGNIILASGVLGNLFLVAQGDHLGYEERRLRDQGYRRLLPFLKRVLLKYRSQIILPVDFIVHQHRKKEIALDDLPSDYKLYDVGQKTVTLFQHHLNSAQSIFMKGPLGFSEIPEFSHGTIEILRMIAQLTQKKGVLSFLGGGHLTTTIKKYKIPQHFSHVSLSGGALIKYIAGEKLPGIVALERGMRR